MSCPRGSVHKSLARSPVGKARREIKLGIYDRGVTPSSKDAPPENSVANFLDGALVRACVRS